MRTRNRFLQGLLAIVLGVVGSAGVFAQGNSNGERFREIDEPTVITQPGYYKVVDNIILNGNNTNLEAAIVVRSSYVTLDLGGFLVRSNSGGQSGTGILVDGAIGVQVQNGSVAMFKFNVVVQNSANVMLTGLRIRGNDLIPTAPPPEVGIMVAQSRNVTIRANNIYNVGLGVFIRGGNSWGNRTTENTITAGRNGILGICYNPTPDDARGPTGDLIDNNLVSTFRTGIQMSEGSVSNVIRDNTIAFIESAFDLRNPNQLVSGNTVYRMLDFTFNR